MSSNRVDIYRIPVDAVGDPNILELPQGVGPYRKITVSEQDDDGISAHIWSLFAPNSDSERKVFASGAECVFESGPYKGGDVLGYASIDTLTSFMVLFCQT